MRETTRPSDLIKGYRIFSKGHVTFVSKSDVDVKSERDTENTHSIRFYKNDPFDYEHFCKAKDRGFSCKHIVAGQFAKFPGVLTPPSDAMMEVFKHYEASRVADFDFDTDVWAYMRDIPETQLIGNLWVHLLERITVKEPIRIRKGSLERAVKSDYYTLATNSQYLAVKLKSLKENEDSRGIKKVLGKINGTRILNEVIAESEADGVLNAKAVVYRLFREGYLVPRRLGEVYQKVYGNYSDLRLILNLPSVGV